MLSVLCSVVAAICLVMRGETVQTLPGVVIVLVLTPISLLNVSQSVNAFTARLPTLYGRANVRYTSKNRISST